MKYERLGATATKVRCTARRLGLSISYNRSFMNLHSWPASQAAATSASIVEVAAADCNLLAHDTGALFIKYRYPVLDVPLGESPNVLSTKHSTRLAASFFSGSLNFMPLSGVSLMYLSTCCISLQCSIVGALATCPSMLIA